MSNYDSYSVTEEMIEKAEKKFDLEMIPGAILEAFTINKDSNYVLMKVSTPGMKYDLIYANLIAAKLNILGIAYTKDGRDVVISTDDFMKLFA